MTDHTAPEEQPKSEYWKGFEELREAVETIRRMDVPDVDAIIPLTEKGLKAYRACESRIQKVEGYLRELEGNAEG